MADLVESLIAVLNGGTVDEQNEALLRAAFFFEKARGWPDCGWTPDVQNEVPSAEKVARLKAALVEFAGRHLTPPPVAAVISALARLEDPDLKGLFRRCIEVHKQGDNGILFAAMLALDRMGENVFRDERGRGHASSLELERNRDLAVQYLKRSAHV